MQEGEKTALAEQAARNSPCRAGLQTAVVSLLLHTSLCPAPPPLFSGEWQRTAQAHSAADAPRPPLTNWFCWKRTSASVSGTTCSASWAHNSWASYSQHRPRLPRQVLLQLQGLLAPWQAAASDPSRHAPPPPQPCSPSWWGMADAVMRRKTSAVAALQGRVQ